MATQDPCELLERLCREPSESEWLEFKVNNDAPKEIGEYVSALANSAMLADRDRAFLVYGIDNKSREKIGTKIRLKEDKQGGENLENYINRMIEPRLMLEFIDFSCDGKDFSIITIEPTYDRPVKFSGSEFIRIGENKRRLIDHPSHERALWLATGRRKFEDAVAATNQSAEQIFEKLDTKIIYSLSGEPEPKSSDEILRKMLAVGFINDNMEGRFDVTNLGAILLAKDLSLFPSIALKSIRVVKYVGRNKQKSDLEQEGTKGYAVGFSGMIRYITNRIPSEEVYVDGVRRNIPVYPEVAIRELIANALIHQDLTIT